MGASQLRVYGLYARLGRSAKEIRMNRRRRLLLGLGGSAVVAFSGTAAAQGAKGAGAAKQGPRFEVDMLWPKPMPNRWILGSVVGVAVDSRVHIYVLSIPDFFTARTEIGAATN